MQFLNTLLNIIIFVVSLGFLVCIHELGHFSMARLFNVYCPEFSIGFGPTLFKRMMKNKETQFSIRALPLGGYVSMAGEETDTGEEEEALVRDGKRVSIPANRTIEGIKKWKKAIIVSAGIILNFVLAWFIFAINFTCVPQVRNDLHEIHIVEEGLFYKNHNISGDFEVSKIIVTYHLKQDDGTFKDHSFTTTEFSTYKDIELGVIGEYTIEEKNGNQYYVPTYVTKGLEDTRTITMGLKNEDGVINDYTVTSKSLEVKEEDKTNYAFELMGFTQTKSILNFGTGLATSFSVWASSCGMMFVAVFNLFRGIGLSDLGGPISIFKVSSMAVTSGFSSFLILWGTISANLAIMNLIPIPGLDGWQLLVTGIEGTTKKKLPAKFKTIATYIGLGFILLLTVVILFKDIFFPII